MSKETHQGTIKLGDTEIPCSVLDTGERVLSTKQVQGLIGAAKDRNLTRISMRIGNDAQALSLLPRKYARMAGGTAHGYVAEDVVNLLRALQRAFLRGELHHKQIPMAMAAMACIESFASVGLVALIDEATGYQQARPADEMRVMYARIFAERRQAWELTFDSDWDKQLCALYRHAYEGKPPLFAKWWNHVVYEYALGKTAKEDLKQLNPNPRFGTNHSQYLTPEAKIVVSQVIHTVKAIMKTCRSPVDFRAKLGAVFHDMPFQLSWE